MLKGKLKKSNVKLLILIIIILIAGIFQKVLLLNNDSDANFSFGMFADEGYKSFNARNLYYFGDNYWHPDDSYIGWHTRSPVMTKIYYFSFKLFGVHLFSVRIVSIVFYILSLLLILMICRIFYKPRKHLVLYVLIFISFSYIYFLYSRIGFLEIPANLFLLIILLGCFFIIKQKKPLSIIFSILIIAAGIFIVMAIKLTSIISIGGILAGTACAVNILYLKNRKNIDITKKIHILRTVLISGVILFFIFYILFTGIDGLRNLFYESRPFNSLANIFLHMFKLRIIAYNPILFLLGALYSVYVFIFFTEKNRLKVFFNEDKNNLILFDFITAVWFLFSFMVTIAFEYHPVRYFLHIYLPLFFLAARFISLPAKKIKEILNYKNILFKIIFIFLCVITFTSVFFSISMSINGFTSITDFLKYGINSLADLDFLRILCIIWPVAAGLAVLFIIFIIFKKNKPGFFFIRLIIISIFLIINCSLYLNWFLTSDDDIYNVSKELEILIPENESIAGEIAPSLGLENSLRTLNVSFVDERVNLDKLSEIKPDNFIFIKGESQDEEFIKIYPDVYRNSVIIKQFTISRFEIEIRKLYW